MVRLQLCNSEESGITLSLLLLPSPLWHEMIVGRGYYLWVKYICEKIISFRLEYLKLYNCAQANNDIYF